MMDFFVRNVTVLDSLFLLAPFLALCACAAIEPMDVCVDLNLAFTNFCVIHYFNITPNVDTCQVLKAHTFSYTSTRPVTFIFTLPRNVT